MSTATNNDITYLSYSSTTSFQPMPADQVPEPIAAALAEKRGGHDAVLFAAGGMCIEWYGIVAEGLELWRLPGCWLVLHDYDDGRITAIIVNDIVSYAMLQAVFVVPLAMKIMASDRFWHGMEQGLTSWHGLEPRAT